MPPIYARGASRGADLGDKPYLRHLFRAKALCLKTGASNKAARAIRRPRPPTDRTVDRPTAVESVG